MEDRHLLPLAVASVAERLYSLSDGRPAEKRVRISWRVLICLAGLDSSVTVPLISTSIVTEVRRCESGGR